MKKIERFITNYILKNYPDMIDQHTFIEFCIANIDKIKTMQKENSRIKPPEFNTLEDNARNYIINEFPNFV